MNRAGRCILALAALVIVGYGCGTDTQPLADLAPEPLADPDPEPQPDPDPEPQPDPDPEPQADPEPQPRPSPLVCSRGTFEQQGACVTCPRQSDCCETRFYHSIVDDLCYRIPDVCLPYAMPVQACPGPLCATDGDCDDGFFCNGQESCVDGNCAFGDAICLGRYCDEGGDRCLDCINDADCDDGRFCNGQEFCEGNACFVGEPPCFDRPCDEATSTCEEPEPEPEATFVAGDLFSFLTPEETTFFRQSVADMNLYIDSQVEIEFSGTFADLSDRGLSCTSLYLVAMCNAEKMSVNLKRQATWIILENVAAVFGLPLNSLPMEQLLEVDAFNCQEYPGGSVNMEHCELSLTCVIDDSC